MSEELATAVVAAVAVVVLTFAGNPRVAERIAVAVVREPQRRPPAAVEAVEAGKEEPRRQAPGLVEPRT